MAQTESMQTIKRNQKDWPLFVAEPEGTPRGALIVIHEIWGLNDEIKRITRNLAKEGYLAVAPELLAEFQLIKQSRDLMGIVFSDPFRANALAVLHNLVEWLHEKGFSKDQIGMLGFCFGGTYTLWYTLDYGDTATAVSFYGQVPEEESLKKIQEPVLVFFGENDDFLTSHRERLQAILAKHDLPIMMHTYPNAGHSFMHPSNPERYRPEAAEDAWRKMVDFFKDTLSSNTA